MNLRLLHNLVLVVLPENPAEQQTAAGLFTAQAFTPPITYGRVARIGPKVQEIGIGDAVAFPPEVGDAIDIGAHACLLVRESDIAAVIPRRNMASGEAV